MSFLLRMSLGPLAGALLIAASPSRAEVVQIPGPAFVRQCPCNGAPVPAIETNGAITAIGPSVYHASLPFQGNGQVCAMSMIYRDVNESEQLTVNLLRKRIQIGGDIDVAPQLVARARSAGGVTDTVRQAEATVNSPTVNSETGFYYLRAEFANVNMDLVGVQVDIRPSCPTK